MTHVILHTDTPDAALALARDRHPDVTFSGCDSYDGLADLIQETGASIVYSVRFAGTPGFPRAAMVENDAVGWALVGGSGTDHLHPWDPACVTVTNAAGVAGDMMAEYTLGGILHFALDCNRRIMLIR